MHGAIASFKDLKLAFWEIRECTTFRMEYCLWGNISLLTQRMSIARLNFTIRVLDMFCFKSIERFIYSRPFAEAEGSGLREAGKGMMTRIGISSKEFDSSMVVAVAFLNCGVHLATNRR